MNRWLLPLLILAAPAAAVAPPAVLRAPVVVPAIGFTAKINDGRVVVSWRRYKRADFHSYQLLKSDKDDPAYVPKASLYATSNAGDVSFEDGHLAPGTWHYRLVILTAFGDQWVSPVVSLYVGADDVKRAAPTVADFE